MPERICPLRSRLTHSARRAWLIPGPLLPLSGENSDTDPGSPHSSSINQQLNRVQTLSADLKEGPWYF